MKQVFLACVALFAACSTPSTAEERKLSGESIHAALDEKVLTGKGGVSQIFRNSGDTFYLEGTNQSHGFWKVDGDAYCSQWPPNQSWSCYDVLQEGNKITFVSKDGQRFEMQLPKAD